MKILLDVTVEPGDRLVGRIGTPARPNQRTFDGAMELIAHIEDLCRQHEHPAPNGDGTETRETRFDGEHLV